MLSSGSWLRLSLDCTANSRENAVVALSSARSLSAWAVAGRFGPRLHCVLHSGHYLAQRRHSGWPDPQRTRRRRPVGVWRGQARRPTGRRGGATAPPPELVRLRGSARSPPASVAASSSRWRCASRSSASCCSCSIEAAIKARSTAFNRSSLAEAHSRVCARRAPRYSSAGSRPRASHSSAVSVR